MPEVKPKDVVKPAPEAPKTENLPAAATNNLPTNWREQVQGDVANVAQTERASSSSIGLQSGILTYQGTPVPGNKLRVIILDAAYERTYYEGAFDRNNIRTPVCFAIKEATMKEGKMGYHDVVPSSLATKPQHETCEGCPQDKWGSNIRNDGTKSRGKACQERRRLLLIPAREDKDMTIEGILGAEVATLKTPVTSTGIYASFAQSCASLMNRPPYGVITELGTEPNLKNQFNLTFKAITTVVDDLMPALLKKREMSKSILLREYEPQTEEKTAPVKENTKY